MSKEVEPAFCEQIVKKYDEKELRRPVYVIQEHHASRLHWDLRFEFDGVLKSWALPKIPPRKEGEKRLAVSVPDHPIPYALFEGQIPEGNYGAGSVKIWDRGIFELVENEPKKIVLNIKGEKLQGKYCLLHFKPQEKNWLFFKLK
ncbi:MAG: 3'-phosphoesterase [Thaumarchaeota archaeon]|nr:3'-phosphoesterase [Nitrososphaerota archaeon]